MLCGSPQKLEKHLELDRQDCAQFFRSSSSPRSFDHLGHQGWIPNRTTGDSQTIADGPAVHLGCGWVRAGASKPIPCVIEVAFDAMNDTMNVRSVAGGDLLYNSVGLIQSAGRHQEQTPDAPRFRAPRLCYFIILGRTDPLNQPLIRHRVLGRKSRQLRIVKEVGNQGRVSHPGTLTNQLGMYSHGPGKNYGYAGQNSPATPAYTAAFRRRLTADDSDSARPGP